MGSAPTCPLHLGELNLHSHRGEKPTSTHLTHLDEFGMHFSEMRMTERVLVPLPRVLSFVQFSPCQASRRRHTSSVRRAQRRRNVQEATIATRIGETTSDSMHGPLSAPPLLAENGGYANRRSSRRKPSDSAGRCPMNHSFDPRQTPQSDLRFGSLSE